MKTLFQAFTSAILVAALQACAPAPSAETLAPASAPRVSNAVVLEDLTFPLPGGEWREVYTHTIPGQSPSAPQTFKVYASISGGVIDRAAVFWVQRKYSYKTRWRQYQSCLTTSQPTVHSAVVTLNEGGTSPSENPRIDCWHVRTLSMGRKGGAHPIIEALHVFAQREGLIMPTTMIGARFAQKRLTDRREYAEYLWNPDVLSPKPGGIWLPDDWSRDAAAGDPARKIAIDRITRWGTAWRPRLLQGGTS